ncbi:hypothetical protein B0A49_08452 [Cryomyces minteri]|uniref:Uncharacterized protein n=1 Tax=Cryomyces minteri TaxID=331657 RepID=A0A4U0WI43_9PEZI|nr:hypothetical protein B0A49_08452 [Cryomyces minteri]
MEREGALMQETPGCKKPIERAGMPPDTEHHLSPSVPHSLTPSPPVDQLARPTDASAEQATRLLAQDFVWRRAWNRCPAQKGLLVVTTAPFAVDLRPHARWAVTSAMRASPTDAANLLSGRGALSRKPLSTSS